MLNELFHSSTQNEHGKNETRNIKVLIELFCFRPFFIRDPKDGKVLSVTATFDAKVVFRGKNQKASFQFISLYLFSPRMN